MRAFLFLFVVACGGRSGLEAGDPVRDPPPAADAGDDLDAAVAVDAGPTGCVSDVDCVVARNVEACCECPTAYESWRVDAAHCIVRMDERIPHSCLECDADCAECPEPLGARCERGVCTPIF